jgi:tetratricopeptide (TPR) repeat protein
MADTTRLEQFRKMAADDPNNELAHFSLGRAYFDAGQFSDAVASYRRTVEINPKISKVYLSLAQALVKLDQRDEAVTFLSTGVHIAHERGEMMPRNEMMKMLGDLGAPVPEFASTSQPAVAVGEGQVLCKRCGNVGPKLARAPFKSAFGEEILAGTCQPCWRLAIGQGTKVINELRLPLSDPQAQKVWDQHIREFLNLGV